MHRRIMKSISVRDRQDAVTQRQYLSKAFSLANPGHSQDDRMVGRDAWIHLVQAGKP